jgi:hypothetical protein
VKLGNIRGRDLARLAAAEFGQHEVVQNKPILRRCGSLSLGRILLRSLPVVYTAAGSDLF